jgi:hypothetical protein
VSAPHRGANQAKPAGTCRADSAELGRYTKRSFVENHHELYPLRKTSAQHLLWLTKRESP